MNSLSTTKSFIQDLEILKQDCICIDTETSGLNPYNGDYIAGIAIGKEDAIYFPIAHGENKLHGENLDPPRIRILASVLHKRLKHGGKIIFHNAAYDMAMLNLFFKAWGLKSHYWLNDIQDTLIAYQLLNPYLPFALKKIAGTFDPDATKEEDNILALMASRGTPKAYHLLSPNEIYPYACKDINLTWKIHNQCTDKMVATTTAAIYLKEMELLNVVISMYAHGILISKEQLAIQKQAANELIMRLRGLLFSLLDYDLDVGKRKDIIFAFLSLRIDLQRVTAHCKEIIKENMKRQRERKPAITNSTASAVLRDTHTQLGNIIIDLRKVLKLQSTFIEGYAATINNDGHSRTSYFQNGAITGRFSSRKPNLQNAKRDAELKLVGTYPKEFQDLASQLNIRNLLSKPETHSLWKLDYSQMEYRMLAFYARDIKMLNDFAAGKDLHQETTDTINARLGKQVLTRDKAKNVNFGMLYGLGAPGLSGLININIDITRQILATYHATYISVKPFIKRVIATAKQRGWVKNFYGRVYSVPKEQEYKLVNYLIQGSCADMIKEKMIAIYKRLQNESAWIVLTIHDELVIQVDDTRYSEKGVEFLIQDLKTIMEDFSTANQWRAAIGVAFPVNVSKSLSGLGDTDDYPFSEKENHDAEN